MKINVAKGILLFLLSLIIGVVSDAIMKYIVVEINHYQLIFLRYFFATVSLLPIIFLKGSASIKTNNYRIHIIRGALLFIAMAIWCYNLAYVLITVATLINFTIPIFTIILARLFLKEKVTVTRWISTIIGFIGVIIIAYQPANVSLSVIMLLLSAIIFSLLDIINKKYVYEETNLSMLFYSNAVVLIMSSPFAIKAWMWLSYWQLTLLFFTGIGANLLLYFMIKSFELADASILVPFRYFEIIIAAFIGYLFFGELPEYKNLVGALFIIPSTLFMSFSEIKNNIDD